MTAVLPTTVLLQLRVLNCPHRPGPVASAPLLLRRLKRPRRLELVLRLRDYVTH
jgi:hypothetical protein